jgi:hypothetical protein
MTALPAGPSPSCQTLPSSKRTTVALQRILAPLGTGAFVCFRSVGVAGGAFELSIAIPAAKFPTLTEVNVCAVRPSESTTSKVKRTWVAVRWLTFVKSMDSERYSALPGGPVWSTAHRSMEIGAPFCTIVVGTFVDAPAPKGITVAPAIHSHALFSATIEVRHCTRSLRLPGRRIVKGGRGAPKI